MILSMEIHSGGIKSNEISELIGNATVVRRLESSDENKSDKFTDIEKKYDVDLYETILSISEWVAFFNKGFVDSDMINSSLKISSYFSVENTPDWIKLWHVYVLEDDEFEALYISVMGKFDRREYRKLGEIKHVAGMFLSFSRKQLIDINVNDVLRECIAYIDEVFDKNLVEINEDSFDDVNGFNSFANLGYSDVESEEFKTFSEYLNKKIRAAQKVELASRTDEILNAMKNDPKRLYALLCHSNHESNSFQSQPVMQYLPENDFVKLFLDIPNASKRIVIDALFHRYEHIGFNSYFIEEYPWLKSLLERLKQELEINTQKVKVSTLTLQYAESRLGDALKHLEKSLPKEK